MSISRSKPEKHDNIYQNPTKLTAHENTSPSFTLLGRKPYSTKPSASPTVEYKKHATGIWLRKLKDMTFLVDWSLIVSLIFGGCCSNVFTLESIIKFEPDSGLIITFVQFIFTTAITAWSQREISSQFPWIIRRPQVPLFAWALSAILFWIVNMMNNWAFKFNISVPVHIILRSGGSVITILVGTVCGRSYSQGQIFGVLLLTIGVVLAAMADAKSKGGSAATNSTDIMSFLQGLSILFVAQVISAIMGLYTQYVYTEYGPHWEENLLWSHLFSLTFFATVIPQLRIQLAKLCESPPIHSTAAEFVTNSKLDHVPQQIFFLLLNSLTQFFCIQGVNRLAARSSALGVTVALNLRKLISLLLSIWLFGNSLPVGVWIGAGFVFGGGAVYAGWDSWRARKVITGSEKKID